MAVPTWMVDLGTIGLSSSISLLIARHTVNKRIDEERQRDIEQWYVEAGVQAELAENDWTNESLSEGSTEDSSEQALMNCASNLEEHAAEGERFGSRQ